MSETKRCASSCGQRRFTLSAKLAAASVLNEIARTRRGDGQSPVSKQLLGKCGSLEAGNVIGDEVRTALKPLEGRSERGVSFVRCSVEAIVGRQLARDLPDAFLGVELRGVAGQPVQFDLLGVLREPCLPLVVEPVAGAVVDDEEELARGVLGGELQQKLVEGVSVEDGREAVGEVGVFERDSAEDVGRLSLPEGIDARLLAYARPGLVESSIEPEAGFVLEEDDAATGRRFFFSAGKRCLIQMACFSASAAVRRLRGRCTEKPIWLSMRGTE